MVDKPLVVGKDMQLAGNLVQVLGRQQAVVVEGSQLADIAVVDHCSQVVVVALDRIWLYFLKITVK